MLNHQLKKKEPVECVAEAEAEAEETVDEAVNEDY